jgi:HSP20 family molecular chaperone IbpA
MSLWNAPTLPELIFGPRQQDSFNDLVEDMWKKASQINTFKATEAGWECELDVPGFDKSELELNIVDDYIWVKGKNTKRSTSFAVTIPTECDINSVDARLVNGVLQLSIKKLIKEEKKKKVEMK